MIKVMSKKKIITFVYKKTALNFENNYKDSNLNYCKNK